MSQNKSIQRMEQVEPERLWTRQEAADYLGVPYTTMSRWQVHGYGPQQRKIGRHSRYVPSEVRAWAMAQTGDAA